MYNTVCITEALYRGFSKDKGSVFWRGQNPLSVLEFQIKPHAIGPGSSGVIFYCELGHGEPQKIAKTVIPFDSLSQIS